MPDSHSDIACGPESQVFQPSAPIFARLAHRFDLDEEDLRQLWEGSTSRVAFIDGFRQRYLAVRGRPRWAEKSPRNVHRFGWILNHFPRAHVIHVIRDGRDVVCSLRTHQRHRVVGDRLEQTGWVMPWEDCIHRWTRSIRDGLALRGHPRYHELRYERLIADPEAALRSLLAALDLDFEPRMLEYHQVEGGSRDALRFPQNVEATLPMYSSAVRRWTRDLSDDERAWLQAELGPELAAAGYE